METLEPFSGWIALALYLAIALWLMHRAVAHLGSTCACNAGADPTQFIWAFVWWPYAIAHGLNPLVSHVMWAPGGINLGGVTSTPGPALVMTPITLLFGPLVSYNVAAIIAPVLGSWTAYRLCRYISRAPWISILAGYVYGYSTYELGHLNVHLNLFLVFLPPLAVLVVLKRLDGVISPRRFAVQLTLILIAQFSISNEILFTMTLVGVAALLAGIAFATPERRRAILHLCPLLLLAYGITAVVFSPYIYEELKAPQFSVDWGLQYANDLISFIAPTNVTLVGAHTFGAVVQVFPTGATETDAYLGVPLILIIAMYLIGNWSARTTKMIAAILAVTVLWTLGGTLYVSGKPTIWLPYAIFQHLPGFKLILQGRIAMYTALVAAVVLALWVSARRSLFRWALAVAAIVCLWPNVDYPLLNARWANPTFFRTTMYRRYIHRNDIVMPIRWGEGGVSLMWQAETKFYFRLASGYFLRIGESYQKLPALGALAADIPIAFPAPYLWKIVIQQDQVANWRAITSAAYLFPKATVGGIAVFDIPKHCSRRQIKSGC
jgi:hypothetical protein